MGSEEKPKTGVEAEAQELIAEEATAAGEPEVVGETGAQGEAQRSSYEELEQLLAEARAKAEENWGLLLRARADGENLRRRHDRDLNNAHKYGLERFVADLLPVLDSLELGVEAAHSEGVDVTRLREGSDLTLKQFRTALDKYAVTVVDPINQKFDPDRHQAMTTQESSEVEPNTVLAVIQKGYLLNDRLVRPAMVVVSTKPAVVAEETSENQTT